MFNSICASWRNKGGGKTFKYDSLDALIVGEGVQGRIQFSSGQWPECLSVNIRGSKGAAYLELFHPVLRVVKQRSNNNHLNPLLNSLAEAGTIVRSGFDDMWRKVRNQTPYEGLEKFLHHTYAALMHGHSPPIGFEEMDQTTRLIDALLAEENRS